MPSACPVCGTAAPSARRARSSGAARTRGARRSASAGLLHFTGRGGIDIEGAGYAVVNQLAERGLLKEPADIFRLDVETLEGLDRYARKSAENLMPPSRARGGGRWPASSTRSASVTSASRRRSTSPTG